jgi:hypothetical protein
MPAALSGLVKFSTRWGELKRKPDLLTDSYTEWHSGILLGLRPNPGYNIKGNGIYLADLLSLIN